MSDATEDEAGPNDIAVIGMSGRFPGCHSVNEYWQALKEGRECIQQYTDEELLQAGVPPALLADPNYVKSGGHLDQMEYFDAGFFGFSPKDAGIMDPQHRLFYECSWEAIENAGHTPSNFEGQIGLFAGCGPNLYFMFNVMTNPNLVRSVGFFLLRHTGNDRDFLPTGVSYKLNLQGPSVAVQTACSTSLVATHMACQSLLSGESDMALAGGSTVNIPHQQGYMYRENEVHSPDGHCRSFDAQSGGTVVTSGVGVVLLRRLQDAIEDGDHIHAVIKSSAINNDGSRKVGYLAPSVDGHSEVVAEALALADLNAEDISYLETHGTGTSVGDPIEIAALTEAFRRSTEKNQFCPIGSVKASIGHTDTAAGVASLIKVVESLKHRQIPASINFSSPNPAIDFENSPFFVNNQLREWQTDGQRRRAGISSLGVGGTNAHVIVEEAPEPESSATPRAWDLLVVSAKTPSALNTMSENLATHLKENPDINLSDLAYTLQIGREPFEHRRILAASSVADAAKTLDAGDARRIFSAKADSSPTSLVFMFPGGGSQYPNMGRELYDTEPLYHDAVDECLNLVNPYIDFDLRAIMFPDKGLEEDTEEALREVTASICSIFISSYAMAQLWMSKGYEPDAMTGHSLGEYVAACIAGVFSLADALKIVAFRGHVLRKLPGATMLSVALPDEQVREYLFDDLDLSAINGPELCLVSGPNEQIDRLAKTLTENEVDSRKLHIASAGHCRLLDPILEEFRSGFNEVTLNAPQRRFICNVTGTWARPEDVTDPEYWVRHFRQTVCFDQGMGELLADPNRILLEVGPGTTLCSLARQQVNKARGIVSSLRHPAETATDTQYLLTAIGRLWAAGMDIDWQRYRGDESRHRLPLPTYPFERQRYWIEPGQMVASEEVVKPVAPIAKLERIDDWFYRPAWTTCELGEKSKKEPGTTLVFADAAGLGSKIATRLRNQGQQVIVVREGDAFYRFNDNDYALAPEEGRLGYDSLFTDLAERDLMPSHIVHCWMLTEKESYRGGSNFFHRNQECGFYSLVFIMQSLGELDYQDDIQIDVVSNGMQAVAGEGLRYPDKATLLGPVRVIPQEFGHVKIRSIDVDLGDSDTQRKSATDPLAALAILLEQECLAQPSNDVIAYRNGLRYVETIESLTLPAMDTSRFRENGVYLITGGLGGIGLKIAEHLASQYHANLILLGRSELPIRDDWDSWLEAHGDRDRRSIQIQTIRKLEKLGAKVLAVSGDVANPERMQTVLSETSDHFGEINGVIHAAGILEDGVIQAKSIETMERVFTPKIHGTLVLNDLFKNRTLDFFLLFSSTSSILGPAGQVDYTAANCFLNALAQSNQNRNLNYVTIDWGVWKDVGGGLEIARRIRGEDVDTGSMHERVGHPLLDECLVNQADEVLFSTKLNVKDHWLLDEHRTGSGQALIPGTGFLEIARSAFAQVTSQPQLEICDLTFLSPLAVADEESKEMRVDLKRDNDRYTIAVTSRSMNEGNCSWSTNATGSIRAMPNGESRTIDLDEIASRCTQSGERFKLHQHELLTFGPRWDVMQNVGFAEQEAIATLELNEAFAEDLEYYELHPAVLDLATGFALPLINGYQEDESLYVPLSYGSVRISAPLSRKIVSHIRSDASNTKGSEIASFNIVIADESGKVLVEIDRFVVKKMSNATNFARPELADSSESRSNSYSQGEKFFLETLECGILAEEGMQAMERVLACHEDNPTIVSSMDFPALIERESQLDDDPDESGIKFNRPELQSQYEEPRDAMERTLAEYWEDLLGVTDIGINDDFFELGGHSLIAVRLFAKIKKNWSVEYPISVLFQAPTIGGCADMLRGELGITLGDENTAEPKKAKLAFSVLVPMTKVDQTDKPAFFLMAGMFGNVLNLRHLAAHLGDDQTVYALQARGLHGEDKPHTRFEDMARDNLQAIREVQPHGPYFIGGFSGGGLVAYEMAQQLVAAGEEIGVFVMLDSIPARIPVAGKLDRLRIQGIHLWEQGLSYPISWAKRRWAWTWESRHLGKQDRELTPAEFRSGEIEAAFNEACTHYQHKPYPGRVELFCPPPQVRYDLGGGKLLTHDRRYLDHANHWEQYVKGGVVVHRVTGNHDSMVLEPNVRVLASELKACLSKAQQCHAVQDSQSKSETGHCDSEQH